MGEVVSTSIAGVDTYQVFQQALSTTNAFRDGTATDVGITVNNSVVPDYLTVYNKQITDGGKLYDNIEVDLNFTDTAQFTVGLRAVGDAGGAAGRNFYFNLADVSDCSTMGRMSRVSSSRLYAREADTEPLAFPP